MAERTLKDVLNAISKMGARLDAKIEGVRADVNTVRSDIEGVRDEVDALRSDVEAGFARVDERFDALDVKIDTVSGVESSTREDTRDGLDALHIDRLSRSLDRATEAGEWEVARGSIRRMDPTRTEPARTEPAAARRPLRQRCVASNERDSGRHRDAGRSRGRSVFG